MSVRTAGLDDVVAIATILDDAWRHAYRGIVPDAHLDSLDLESSARRVRTWIGAGTEVLVVERDGSVVGHCSLLPSRDADARLPTGDVVIGEVAAIYVSPSQARRGAGRALLRESVTRVRGRYRALTLWVLAQNAPARAFYEAMGFSHDGGRKQVVIGGVALDEVRYRLDVPDT